MSDEHQEAVEVVDAHLAGVLLAYEPVGMVKELGKACFKNLL